LTEGTALTEFVLHRQAHTAAKTAAKTAAETPVGTANDGHPSAASGGYRGGLSPVGLRTEIAVTLAQVEALGPHWAALDSQMQLPLFFQSFGWCRFVVRFRTGLASQPEHRHHPFAPRVITVWDGGTLQAIWPLQLRHARGHRLLLDLGDPVNQYGGALIAPGTDQALIAAQLVAVARTLADADGLLLRKVHVGSALANALAATGFAVGEGDAAPFVSLKGHTDFAAFYKTLLSRTRRNVRQGRERFEAAGRVDHHVCWGRTAVGDALRQAMRLKQEWLDEKMVSSWSQWC
jgi:CelD/BcsL family acetyltransferase involved in cellulose biosynthesis